MLLSIEPRYFSRSKTDRQTDDETLLVDLPPQFSSHTVHFYIRLLPLFHTPSTSVHFITINTEQAVAVQCFFREWLSLQLRHPSRYKVYFNPPADFPLWRGDSLVACFVANPL